MRNSSPPEMGQARTGPFCCWAFSSRRRKHRRRIHSHQQHETAVDETAKPALAAMPPSDVFHYFGIPLRTPADYYRFLELPGRRQQQQKQQNGETQPCCCWTGSGRSTVKVLGVGRGRRHSRRQELSAHGQTRIETTDGEQQPGECCCNCSLPSCSSSDSRCRQPLYGQLNVRLAKRPGQQLGLGIAGGSDKPVQPTVSYLRPGFAAHRCDQIQVGDRLIAVNGVRVDAGLTHGQVLSLLRNAGGDCVDLELEYDLNGPELVPRTNRSAGIVRRQVNIELREENDEQADGLFGLTIRGGAFGPDPDKRRPLTATAIRTGGPAHREGRLRVGDRLLAINGVSLTDCTLSAAVGLVRSSSAARSSLLLTVEYDVSTMASVRKAPGPLLLEIEKVPGTDFGTELDIRRVPTGGSGSCRRAVTIRSLVPASVADRIGAVKPGDELLAIDGISLEMVGGLAEAYQLLRSQSAILRLELAPASRGTEDCLRKAGWKRPGPEKQPVKANSSRSESEEQRRNGCWTTAHPRRPAHRSESPRRRRGSVSVRLSTGLGPLGSVCHSESMELALAQEACQNWPSFGIVLGRQRTRTNREDSLEECGGGHPLVVAHIERGSPADKCGVLQVGDRLLCIEDWHTAEGSLEEGQHLLRAVSLSATRSATLLVEFNVIEPVLPPEPGSLFVVRLAKRANCLGIVCRSERQGAAKGQPLVISHIRMGSVAHRCGSIQVGDRVHSIDDIPLAACTVDESMRLLQRSAQVVKLHIAKGGGQEQELLDSEGSQQQSQAVIYAVELSRKGRPLGITIASAGGLLDPIIISQLAPGGLAEKTGALHAGDRIVAVNGESLEGKKVGQVTQMLQQCPDPVSIKVCRQLPAEQQQGRPNTLHSEWHHSPTAGGGLCTTDENGNMAIGEEGGPKVGTPMKSVDSAMDSLEDSPPDGQQFRHGRAARLAQLRPSASNNFQQSDLISGGSSADPYSGGWDSGLSSAAATESQQGQKQPATTAARGAGGQNNKCCGCQLDSQQPSCSNSPQSSSAGSSDRAKEEWVHILEALETVGEEEMLRKLEECILSGQASNYGSSPSAGGGSKTSQGQLLPSECGVLSRRFIPGSTGATNNNYAALSAHSFGNLASSSRPSLLINQTTVPKSPPPLTRRREPPGKPTTTADETASLIASEEQGRQSHPATPVLTRRNGLLNHQQSGELPPSMPSPRGPTAPVPFPVTTSTFAPPSERTGSSTSIPFITSPVDRGDNGEEEIGEDDRFDELSEVFSIQLAKCPITNSFGFSVCDGPIVEEAEHCGAEQQGIYIRSVIRDGPAEKSGRVRPGDRILQINGRSIQFLTCDLTLPLLTTTDKVDLLLLRRRTQQQRRPVKF